MRSRTLRHKLSEDRDALRTTKAKSPEADHHAITREARRSHALPVPTTHRQSLPPQRFDSPCLPGLRGEEAKERAAQAARALESRSQRMERIDVTLHFAPQMRTRARLTLLMTRILVF